jgi:hypothetical protein
MAVGLMFDDGPGQVARGVAVASLGVMGLYGATITDKGWHAIPVGFLAWYPLVIVAWAGGFAVLARDRLYLVSSATSLAAWLLHSGIALYEQLRRVLVGLDQIAWGLLFFALAMAISLRKAGIWPRTAKRPEPLLAGEALPAESTGEA